MPLVASLPIESVAVNAVAAFGVNEMLKFVLSPAPTDTGSVGEAIAKYLLDSDALLIVTVLFPELVTVSKRLLLVLGLTLPKSRLELLRTRFPLCWLEPDPELDWLTP